MASGIVEPSSSSQSSEAAGSVQQQQGASRSKLVQRLLTAGGNLPAFLDDLLTTQAVVVAGTEAAGFLIEKAEEGFTLRPVAHKRPDQSSPETRAAAIAAFQNLLRPCVVQQKDGAVEIGSPDENGEPQFCLVTLLRSEGQIVAVSAVITRCRNVERARQRLMSMELVAGYFELYSLRRVSEQSRQIAQSHQHVLQLATSVATAEGFESAAMNLCNELATRTGAVRVSIGWLKGEQVKVKALSHTEKFDKKQELVVQLQRVMEECLDQEEIVHYDPSGQSSQNVTRSAQEFSRTQGGNIVLSLPLRRAAEVIGVVTLEYGAQQKLAENAAAGLAVAVDLLAPQLYDRYQNDRWLIVKAGHSIQETAKLAIGPKHMLAKLIIALVIAAGLFVTFYKPTYHVSAPFQFTPLEKRSICAPTDGFIYTLAKVDGQEIQPGTKVRKGQELLRLDTKALEQKRDDARSQARSKELEANLKRSDPAKTAEANIAMEQRKQALIQVALYEDLISQSILLSPIDGEILKGDLRDKKGGPVKEGEVLFEIARRDNLEAELTVAERDVQLLKEGQIGTLATTSLPTDKYDLRITRIVPLGEPKDGENIFKVYAAPDKNSADWRPGLVGEARVEIGPKRLVWIWTHRLVDFLRLKFWI